MSIIMKINLSRVKQDLQFVKNQNAAQFMELQPKAKHLMEIKSHPQTVDQVPPDCLQTTSLAERFWKLRLWSVGKYYCG